MLMEEKKYALEVYNALNGSSYDDPNEVESVSLERGVSLTIRNDASFIVDANFTIYEHQSTYNPNMPLRSLFYFTAHLKTMIENRDLFSKNKIMIPTPHFAVFYNGQEDKPNREVLRLSASFEKPADQPELELVCTVYNINPNKDVELLNKCSVLCQYTLFVEKVREHIGKKEELPIRKAIDYCIENHILEDFLREHRAEVERAMAIDMSFERREELFRKEEHELGRAEGYAEGHEKGHAEGHAEGRIKDIKNIMKSMNLTEDQAMQALDIAEGERAKYLELLNKSN